MRAAGTSLLITAMTVVAMASIATAASAQAVELLDEEPGANGHCPAVTPVGAHSATGGCVIHVAGLWIFTSHTGSDELPVSSCSLEFTARFDEDGFGYILNQQLAGQSCGLAPCDEAAPSHVNLIWPAVLFEGETESGASTEGMAMTFCVRAASSSEGGPHLSCTITMDVFQSGHSQILSASPSDPSDGEGCAENPSFEFSGELATEVDSGAGEGEMELTHGVSPNAEVTNEATGAHCPSVSLGNEHAVSGGCVIHFNSEDDMLLQQHTPSAGEVPFSICQTEFLGRIDEDGSGYITNQFFVPAQPCGVEACDEPAPSHASLEWPVTVFEGAGGTELIRMAFCVKPAATAEGSGNVQCTVTLPMTATGDHAYELTANGQRCAEDATISVTGHWVTELGVGDPALEVSHTP